MADLVEVVDPRALRLYSAVAHSGHSGHSRRATILCGSEDLAHAAIAISPDESVAIAPLNPADETLQKATMRMKPTKSELADFYDGFARALDIGTGVAQALDLLSGVAKSPVFRGIVAQVAADVRLGMGLSGAFSRHPQAFDKAALALIAAGEASGRMIEMLKELAKAKRREVGVWKKIGFGMVYPGVVLAMGIGVMLLLTFQFLPQMEKAYATFKAELPGSTQAVLTIGRAIRTQPWLLLLPVGAIYLIIRESGKFFALPNVQRAMLKVPGINGLVQRLCVSRSLRTLSLLLQFKVPLDECFGLAAEASGHVTYHAYFTAVHANTAGGDNMFLAFAKEKHRVAEGQVISSYMKLGEETGEVAQLLARIADAYEEELDLAVQQIDKLLQPVTIIALGLMVAGMAHAVYTPIFKLGNAVVSKEGKVKRINAPAPLPPPTR